MQIGRPTYDYDPALPDHPTIIHSLAETAARVPDRTAIIAGDRSITFAQYLRAVAGYAATLAERGVAGGRVVLLMGNGIEVAVASLAAMAAGAQAAPMNAMFPAKALVPLVKDVDPTVIVCDAMTAELARGVAKEAGVGHVDVFAPDALSIEAWIDDASLTLPQPMPGPDDRSLLFFTGGTTGLPKAADHIHANEMAYCKAANTVWPVKRDEDVILMVAPNFHIWGFCYSAVTPVYLGATVDFLPAYVPEVILKRFEENKVTVFAGGPAALYVGLMANENFATTDFSSLRLCLAGGSPCPEALLERWEAATGCAMLEGWGMSEGSPINMNPVDGVRKAGSVGPMLPRTEADIVDLETGTKVLPQGERGEIRLRGPQFITGYRNRPEDNKETFRDGWLYTGDIGRFDEDGYLYLVDRKKEMILVGGYNVYPREVDEVLNAHPAVMEAATIGVPDAFRGEAVKACVALKPRAEATAEELIAHCQEHLVKYKVPAEVEFFDALPKTGPAKIDKLKLKGLR